MNPCTTPQSEVLIGTSSSVSSVHWVRTYSLQQTYRVYLFFEYIASGNWNNDDLLVYVNGVVKYTKSISITDQNRLCNDKFLYRSTAVIIINQFMDQLKLEILVNAANVGLYFRKILLSQNIQAKRVVPSTQILSCTGSLTLKKYYCTCSGTFVTEDYQCKSTCSQNYLYDSSTNTCYQKTNCASCSGTNGLLACDNGYYKYQESNKKYSNCVATCPRNYYQDEINKQCVYLQDYIFQQESIGGVNYGLDYYNVLPDITRTMHLFKHSVTVTVISTPPKIHEQSYYFNGQNIVVGQFDTFSSQVIVIDFSVLSPQYKLVLRATGHFIDFYPTKNEVTINGVTMSPSSIISAQTNEQQQSKLDYMAYYDSTWTRTEISPRIQNTIIFSIQQPLQNSQYQGYFYLNDIYIYAIQCAVGCNSCYSLSHCVPCMNPLNKNPSDCTCLAGYIVHNDICIACPSICTYCVTAGVCDSCKASTKRINSPNCDQCPNKYFLMANTDDCQTCLTGCYQCQSGNTCDICLAGYFRNSLNKCLVLCEDGFYNDISNVNDPKCTVCDSNCQKCSGSATHCTGCSGSATLITNQCYSCPQGQYLSGTSCLPCISQCLQCTATGCTLCSELAYYYNPINNQCTSICNSNQFPNLVKRTCDLCDSSCLTCSDHTNSDCLSCAPPKILNQLNIASGICSNYCLTGYFKVNTVCSKCRIECYSCVDSTKNCLLCASDYFRLKSTGYCYDICPPGYYNNKVGNVCSLCNQACATCNGMTAKNCLSCTAPLGYFQNQCYSICPDNYGNVNSICVKCTPNCKQCFGQAPNQCQFCSKGFYELNNQCFFQCPAFYVGIRPQYKCKCIFENCITCQSNEFFYNNHCFSECPPGTFGYNGLCFICDSSCGTCFGEANNQCLSCIGGTFLLNNFCVTECVGKTYPDTSVYECKDCDPDCASCTGPNNNNCTSCYTDKLLDTQNTCVDNCPSNSYAVTSESRCYQCDASCLTCFNGSINGCLTCVANKFFYLYECVDSCPDGFHESVNQLSCDPNFGIVIPQCEYECSSCDLTARFCTSCAANRMPNQPNCDCQPGYYDDGANPTCLQCDFKCLQCKSAANHCLKCRGNRLLPNCQCPMYYYDDGFSQNCFPCQDNCGTCNEWHCLTCRNNRINSPDCVCQVGYYEAYDDFCPQCEKKCSTCSESARQCLTCSGNRGNPPICGCPPGYFENSDEDCQQCNETCIDCNELGCLTCFANREGPVDGACSCSSPGASRLNINSIYCTDCQLGVPEFGLNLQFTGFSINFGAQVIYSADVNATDICGSIFETDSLLKLGTNPICDFEFNILFGDNPNIEVDDILQLKKSFQLIGCFSKFTQILPMPLSIPSTYHHSQFLPILSFLDLLNPNVCIPLAIQFDQKLFNGNQKFKIIQWVQILPLTTDPQIDAILQANTLNNSEKIEFPPKLLQTDTLYKFSVTFESFAKLTNSATIQFKAVKLATVVFQPDQTLNQFHRFDPIALSSKISYYNCIDQQLTQVSLSYQIILQNTNENLLNGTITSGLVDGYQLSLPLNFDPYYFNFTNPYTLIFDAIIKGFNFESETQTSLDLFIISSAPHITIAGGNRMVGYLNDLYLNATITDQDYQDNQTIYNCYWSCRDLVNDAQCKNQKQELIFFTNDCSQLIPAKTLLQYSVSNFEVSVLKNDVAYSTKVSVQVIEEDLPTLVVIGVDSEEIHNYYDELIYKLVYSGINPDFLVYAGAIIYHSTIQATFEFYYLDLKFMLQNYFTKLSAPIGTTVKLRLSVYDPSFVMPSLNTEIINMNIPPQNCEIFFPSYSNIIEFFEYLDLRVINCIDTDIPLLYSVWLYPNATIYESDLLQSHFKNYLVIAPQQRENTFRFTIPYFTNDDCLLVISIQDNLGGIVNITQSIQIREFLLLDCDTMKNFEINQTNFNDILIRYRKLAERLSRITSCSELKEEVFTNLTFLDKSQSMSSNQTESLYHSIAILVSQNSSLVYNYYSYLVEQLYYRANYASSRLLNLYHLQLNNSLTSNQNIDKSNFIQQYNSFINIYSSLINYRVSNNLSSTEIIYELSSLVGQLQDVSVANEPLYKAYSNSVILNFGYLTTKMVSEFIGSNFTNGNDTSISPLNETTYFYKYSQTRYIDNPFYSQDEFPKNSSGYQAVDPKLLNQNQTSNGTILYPRVKFSFPIPKKVLSNTTLKCITEVNSGNWSADICKTVQRKKEIVCECNTLNPTSIMESLIFVEKKAEQLYSLNTLAAILSFPFYETVAFYFYLGLTAAYIKLIFWGMKVDSSIFEKIDPEPQVGEIPEEMKSNIQIDKKSQLRDTRDRIDQVPILMRMKDIESQFQKIKQTIFQKRKSHVSMLPFPQVDQLQLNSRHQLTNFDSEKHIDLPGKASSISPSNDLCTSAQIVIGASEDGQLFQITLFQAYIEYVKYFHQILSIIYKDDNKKPRGLRASIVYTSIIGSLSVLFVFNQPSNLSFTIALALITAPLNKIYQILLEKLLSNANKSVRVFGGGVMITVAGFESYTMLAGLVLSGSIDYANQWSYLFIGTFIVDNLFYCPLQLALQYCLHTGVINFPLIQRLLDKVLDVEGKDFFKKTLSRKIG